MQTTGWELVRRAGRAVGAALVPWLVARVIVVGALGAARFVVDRAHPADHAMVQRVHEGLLGWDAGWYKSIALVGYGALGHQSLRFFPLVPLATRALAVLPGVSDGAALVVIANLCALVATAMLWVLVRRERRDDGTARRALWLLCLAPPAFTLVMGYAEGPLLVCTIGCFLALRNRGADGELAPAWWWAALAGLAAALTRPLGVLLVIPVVVEAVRHWPRADIERRVASMVAALAPVGGLLAFLAWSAAAFGNFWAPLSEQTSSRHHGGFSDPFTTLGHDAAGVFHHHVGTAMHVPWVVLVVVLVVVCLRRWPLSYGLFALAIVLVSVSGTNLDSFERYALSAFPLVLVGADLTASDRVWRCVLALSAAGLFAYALLAFCNIYVP